MMKMWESFADVNVKEEGEIVVSYRTGNFVLEEGLMDGSWVTLSMNAAGYMMDTNPLPRGSYMNTNQFVRPQAFHVCIDGQDLDYRWQYEGAEITKKGEAVIAKVTLTSQLRPVKVILHTYLDGTPVLQRHLEIVNLSDKVSAISYLAIMSGGMQTQRVSFPEGSPLYRLGYIQDSHWGGEGDFRWHELSDGETVVSGRYRRDRHRHPLFMVENLGTGELFYGQLGFSGGYSFRFDHMNDREACNLSFEACIDAPAPLRLLAAGERFETPKMHLGCVFGGFDMAVNAMHEHVRKSVLFPPTRGRTGWVLSGIGPEYDMSRDETIKAIDVAAEFGVDLFYVDAGWYTPPKNEGEWWNMAGIWRYNTDRYPNGIEEIRDYTHKKGMLFGLWMDADRVGPASDIWKNHSEMIATTYTGKQNPSGLLDNTCKSVCAWMKSEIEYIIRTYQLDMFRLDHNVGAREGINAVEKDGYLENSYLRYYENVYEMYAELRREFPDVVFENCAGGGGRTDLGLVANFTHTWVTDWQLHPNALRITNGMTIALPPETVNRLTGGQTAYVTADFDMQMRNLMFAQPCFGFIDPTRVSHNPNQIKRVQKYVRFYKEFVRPMHKDMWFFHHTPELTGKQAQGYAAMEMANRSAERGMVGVFQLAQPAVREITVYPRGVDESRSYLVTFDNSGAKCVVSGYDLAQRGLRVRLDGALVSELITYQAQD